MLQKTREDEILLDSVVAVGASGSAPLDCELDATIPVQSPDKVRWHTSGAKPKRPGRVSFTPRPQAKSTPQHEWQTVTNRPIRSPTSYGYNSDEIRLSNRFSIFQEHDFPPLACRREDPVRDPGADRPLLPAPPPPSGRERPSSSPPATRPAGSSPPPAANRQARPSQPLPAPRRPRHTPSTLIVGDSIVKRVHFPGAATRCLPGATVQVLLDRLPELLRDAPQAVSRLVVHVGTNDVSRRQSERTKLDFIALFEFLKSTGKTVFISGPIPTIGRGSESFSRLLQLSTWLALHCSAYGLVFIDNFNLFWNRPSFYFTDGLHPSSLGSNVLSATMHHVILTRTRV